MDIQTAIKEIRKRLDEIELLLVHLPKKKPNTLLHDKYPTLRLTGAMRDWMDLQEIPKGDSKAERVRKGLLRVANLIEDGLTLEQIKKHRLVRSKPTLTSDLVDRFYEAYKNRP